VFSVVSGPARLHSALAHTHTMTEPKSIGVRSQQLTIHTKLPTSRFDENPLRSSIILQQTKTPKPVASGSLRVLGHRN
jgi:hypothetical protein